MAPFPPKPVQPVPVYVVGKHSVVVKHWRQPGLDKTLCDKAIGDRKVAATLARVCTVCSREMSVWEANAARAVLAWQKWHGVVGAVPEGKGGDPVSVES